MSQRLQGLNEFLDGLQKALPPDLPSEAQAMLARVWAKLKDEGERRSSPPSTLPVCARLDPVLAGLDQPGAPLGAVVHPLRGLAADLRWSERPDPNPEANPAFYGGHANAMIIGPGGIEDRRDLWVGISLLAPGVRYPDHDHAPPEVYLVLTPGEFAHGGSEWFSPGVGGSFYNTPGIRHAMRAGPEAPLVAIWILDVG